MNAVKEIIETFNFRQSEISMLQQEIEEIRRKLEKIKVTNYGGEPGGNPDKDIKEKLIDAKAEIEEQIAMKKYYCKKVGIALEALEKRFPKEFVFFRLRYIESLSFKEIEGRTGYSRSATNQKIKKIENEFTRLMSIK